MSESMQGDLLHIIDALKELHTDAILPKNIREKVSSTILILEGKSDISLKKNKALTELEDVAEDTNLQPYSRTSLFSIISMLENISL